MCTAGRIAAACAACACALCLQAHAAEADADLETLQRVNIAINHRIVFADDMSHWGVADYWATPAETEARAAGDCEDIAIDKYFELLAAGMPPSRLRLAYAEVRIGGADGLARRHVVVAYLPADGEAGDERILDNLIDEVRPLRQRTDLHVLISFDRQGIWRGLERGPSAREARAIRRWSEVLDRVAGVPGDAARVCCERAVPRGAPASTITAAAAARSAAP